MGKSTRAALLPGLFALLGAISPWHLHTASAAPAEQRRATIRALTRDALLRGFDPHKRVLRDGRYVVKLPAGGEAALTVSPELDDYIARELRHNHVQAAGVVAIEPKTGRVLAYVSHAEDPASTIDYARDASAPAASVFKVITGAALLSQGVRPETSTCYHGGSSALQQGEIIDQPRLDTACASMTGALGYSINAVFAKLALKHLSPQKLADYAGTFGFGEHLPFDVPVPISAIDVPKEPLEFARTAAGFWHMRMSPLHAAMIGGSVGQHGRMMRPSMVEEIRDARGKILARFEPALHRNVLEKKHADALNKMMRATVKQGTARRSFHDGRGQPYLPGIEVAGKTGTLSQERPYKGYTWWVGFAPADDPKIAIAVLAVNSPLWRIKAPVIARDALRHYLVEMPRMAKSAAVAAVSTTGG